MKREVKIVSLAYAQSQAGSYVVVLSELNGFRKLPVIVKTSDAQQIALKLEKMDSPRPTTHDVVSNLSSAFNIDCVESSIYSVVEGIFYSKSTFSNGIDDVNVECSCGDAIILSLNFGCPLYVTEDVLSSCGIVIDDDGNLVSEEPKVEDRKISIEDLKIMMEDAISEEEYELAAELRDQISKLESGS